MNMKFYSNFTAVLLEDNKSLRDMLKGRSMPKKVRYTVKSDGFGKCVFVAINEISNLNDYVRNLLRKM